jgi:transcriptional regulator with XRE-family HTH domain
MRALDKAAMGRRIKEIRTEAGLRQWQLAERLGTTQSAVHKYEHGVVPEPRRLVELARVGQTTVEWILTGHHWEDGAETRERLPKEVYRIARAAAVLDASRLHALQDALELLERVAEEIDRIEKREGSVPRSRDLGALTGASSASRTLSAALRFHRCVVEAALEIETRRFRQSASPPPRERGKSRR